MKNFTRHINFTILGVLCIILLIGFLWASTNRKSSSFLSAMVQAESIVDAHPDSALNLLAPLENEIRKESEEAQAYYALLTIKAKDKLFIPHVSDSAILSVVKFYEAAGDKERLTEAYYYLGGTYRDMDNVPQALKAYHQAINIGEKTKLYSLQGLINGQIAMLFAHQKLYDESIKASLKSQDYYGKTGDSLRYAGALQNIARAYSGKQENDSVLLYYRKAYQLCKRYGYTRRALDIASELGCYYYNYGKKDEARVMLMDVIAKAPHTPNALLFLGYIYQDNQTDSASFYFNEALRYGNLHHQSSAYRALAQMASGQGDDVAAISYNAKYQQLRDSLEKITQTDKIEKLHLTCKYQHEVQKNQELGGKNTTYLRQIYLLLFCLVVTAVVGILVSRYIRQKKQMALEQEKRLGLAREKKYEQSLACIKANEQKLKEKEKNLLEANADKDRLYKQLVLSQKEMMELTHRQSGGSYDEQKIQESVFHQSDIYIRFHQAANGEDVKLIDAHWNELKEAIDTTYFHFTDRLYALYPHLSPMELSICYLVKISIPVKGISLLLHRTKAAITLSRSRLYKKIHGTEGTGEMFDQFILDL